MYESLTFSDSVGICPYNKNHIITKSRLQKHIVKCEKQFPTHYKVMCPYNATHRLFKEELEEHIITCPARNILKSEIYPEEHNTRNFIVQSEFSNIIDGTENWDLEINNSMTLTKEEYFIDNNSRLVNISTNSKKQNEDFKMIRAPRGFSEAILTEPSEDSYVEDVESVVSSMGIGRGKITLKNDKLKLIGMCRGRSMDNFS
ncbi:Gametocyte-specific factor 1 [Eufriesea mexicana]|uniref:gametocyte-specific factor 1-like n=1 Tax=Eufriesea mexicana TaxID=516756 RepID=UPI00083C6B2D|nr:PREDICTED: gametocyte-specific factor 1-like [Eufriesea mexicana]OAD54812.1 Gametocyte-specific factor 1 [Eufriesea mexicana]